MYCQRFAAAFTQQNPVTLVTEMLFQVPVQIGNL
jgi:hypothetical protein